MTEEGDRVTHEFKSIIHYTLHDGSEDSVTLSAENIALLREKAFAHVSKVCGTDPWSEDCDDE